MGGTFREAQAGIRMATMSSHAANRPGVRRDLGIPPPRIPRSRSLRSGQALPDPPELLADGLRIRGRLILAKVALPVHHAPAELAELHQHRAAIADVVERIAVHGEQTLDRLQRLRPLAPAH